MNYQCNHKQFKHADLGVVLSCACLDMSVLDMSVIARPVEISR